MTIGHLPGRTRPDHLRLNTDPGPARRFDQFFHPFDQFRQLILSLRAQVQFHPRLGRDGVNRTSRPGSCPRSALCAAWAAVSKRTTVRSASITPAPPMAGHNPTTNARPVSWR
ncbi:MAG: hypothetical protein MZV64_23515 [Ignavibacteriales bacterium]|nr:hypothetical protein [Ignavibacteriales bacterium]